MVSNAPTGLAMKNWMAPREEKAEFCIFCRSNETATSGDKIARIES
jgi:hypothetical protein